MLLNLLTKGNIKYILVVVFVVVLSFWLYIQGSNSANTRIIEQEAREFQDTTDRVNQGLNEVRRANPSRDANIALERLRERQSER